MSIAGFPGLFYDAPWPFGFSWFNPLAMGKVSYAWKKT